MPLTIKKWITTKLFGTVANDYNDNLDAIKAFVDGLEATVDGTSQCTAGTGVSNLKVVKNNKVVMLRFEFKPTSVGFTSGLVTIPAALRPVATVAAQMSTAVSTADAAVDCVGIITASGAVTAIATGTLPTNNLIFSATYITN